MSIRLHIFNVLLRLFEKRSLANAKTHLHIRKSFSFKAKYLFPAPRNSRFERDEFSIDNTKIPVLWARAKVADDSKVILYLHGGGYIFGSPETHQSMLARLSAMTGMTTCLIRYRLAPEHAFPAAIDDAVNAYRALLARGIDPVRIILGGDSAGGGLVLALLGDICAQNLPQPAGVFALSPLTDLRFEGQSFTDNAKSDVILPATRAKEMAEYYLQGADPDDPRASPLQAAFKEAAPIYITVGDTEILLDDTKRMTTHLKAQGVDVTEKILPNHPHVWQIFQRLLPEADESLRDIAKWIKPLLQGQSES